MEEGGDDILYVSFSLSLSDVYLSRVIFMYLFFLFQATPLPEHASCWEFRAAAKLHPFSPQHVISLPFPSERRLSLDEV